MMKIKYLLLSSFLIGSAHVVYGQQKLKDNTVQGSPLPNKDAVLELESNKKGLLHARLNLVRTTDASPLTAHVAGMMVYNTASVNDVKPGIYYNDGNKWLVLSNGLAQNIAYDPLLNKITYTDATGSPQSIDLIAAVKANETLTLLVANPDGTLSYTDEKGIKKDINLPALIKNHETKSVLKDNGDGTLTFTNEKGEVVNVTLTSGKQGASTYEIAVKNGFIGSEAIWLASLKGATGPAGAAGTAGNTVLNGSAAPTGGADGDFFLNTTTNTLYGPKAGGLWPVTGVSLVGATGAAGPAGAAGAVGAAGNAILNGADTPTGGADGDFFLNTTTNTLYGPKAGGLWPATGVSLVGPAGATGPTGAAGAVGAAGNAILNGAGIPTGGADGDFFLNTTTNTLYGPKAGGLWPATGVSLVGATGAAGPAGPAGAAGAVGAAGNAVLNGVGTPTGGADGDFFLNTTTNTLYGPKAGGLWPATGVSLMGPAGATGPAGAAGAVGAAGNAVLNGSAAPTGGADGDFFLNTTTNTLYGPKAGGLWSATGVSLAGPAGATGPAGADGKSIINGTVAPLPGDGKPGDFYLNTVTNILYGPKNETTGWPATGVPLSGPKFFYMPPVIFDTSSPGATEIKRNLYEEFKAQFTGVVFIKNDVTGGNAGVVSSDTFVSSTGTAIPAVHIPAVSALDYYITYYDKNSIEIVSLSANGLLTYKVKANATAATYMNIVFVIK
ncbi:hypothetical protein [Pedobacter gandavensis]|uniref:hypothetical protein n=1 Tax=Pedobacter gandavensis TaxID=2679963 RepID=UPI00292E21DA|nr:hypothetical protein [Pedobacter gandavensis]